MYAMNFTWQFRHRSLLNKSQQLLQGITGICILPRAATIIVCEDTLALCSTGLFDRRRQRVGWMRWQCAICGII